MSPPSFLRLFLAAAVLAAGFSGCHAYSGTAPPAVAAADMAAGTRTEVHSMTTTSISKPAGAFFGPTIITMITTETLVTMIPEPTAADQSEVVETVFDSRTYEYIYTFSEGNSGTSFDYRTYTDTMTVPV